jgi:hypothetical protein
MRGLPALVLALSGAELCSLLPVSDVAGFGPRELASLSRRRLGQPGKPPLLLEVGLLCPCGHSGLGALWAVVALLLFRLTGKRFTEID